MNIDIYPVSKKSLSKVINTLLTQYGVPKVYKDMSIYYAPNESDNTEMHLRFRNKNCLAIFIDEKTDKTFRPRVTVDTDNTTIKSLLEMYKKIGFNNASVGIATCFGFLSEGGVFLELMLDTYIGDFIQVGYERHNKVDSIEKVLFGLDLRIIDRSQLKPLVDVNKIKNVEIIDDFGKLTEDAYQFTKSVGLSLETKFTSLKSKISWFDNDYSYLEKAFKNIFNSDLVTKSSIDNKFGKYIKNVSIIIPCFNTGDTFIKTLLSIEKQNLPKDIVDNFDVILVDDGSDTSVQKVLDENKGHLNIKPKVVRLNSNMGLSAARNVGLSVAKNGNVVFLDSDVVLPSNYILEHVLRNRLIPNAIFVSFKENVSADSDKVSFESISNGIPPPNVSNDSRIKKSVNDELPSLYDISGEVVVEILSQTNCFKDFGRGRNIGIFDLPSMVVGHNMTCRKENLLKINGFSNQFTGWGMEDTYFGARMIANGNFVIPILSTGVYHIDHAPRSGSQTKKFHELKRNLKRYNELLDKPLEIVR
ncbi:MAG: glycosyltransferase [Patescibacteria group bacterium]